MLISFGSNPSTTRLDRKMTGKGTRTKGGRQIGTRTEKWKGRDMTRDKDRDMYRDRQGQTGTVTGMCTGKLTRSEVGTVMCPMTRTDRDMNKDRDMDTDRDREKEWDLDRDMGKRRDTHI